MLEEKKDEREGSEANGGKRELVLEEASVRGVMEVEERVEVGDERFENNQGQSSPPPWKISR